MRDPLHTLQEGEVFVVATLAGGGLVDLEVRSRPPTFHLREDQVALVANADGSDSAESLTIGDLLAHCADTLGMDTDDEGDPTSRRRWPRTSSSPSASTPPPGSTPTAAPRSATGC